MARIVLNPKVLTKDDPKGGNGPVSDIQKGKSRRKGTLGGHATAKPSKADEKDHDTRVAVTRGDTFADILRDSTGFESSVSTQEYLNYVADKRDRFLQDRKKLRDISPGLLHEHDGSPLSSPAKDYLNYSDHKGVQYAPTLRRADRGFFQRALVPATKGKIWSRGNIGAEEEVSLHPFNTVDQFGGDAGNAIFLANVFSPFSDLADKSTDEIYLGTNSGVHERMRVVEFQRALAGLKRRVLTHVNRVNNDAPVAARADEASRIVRDILTKSRYTYENTDGTPADKDRAVFAMIRRDFGDMVPHDNPTPVSTGFDQHTTTAVRAFATLPARARDGDGLHNLLKPKELRGPLEGQDLNYFRRALNIMESALPGSRTDTMVDLIDATAGLQAPSRKIDKDVYADAKGGDAGAGTAVPGTPVSEAPQKPGGPRIVINPQVFSDRRDALCVAMNEAFRLVMEENGFEPVSEPTEAQRKFFSDTAYANDELQLRRTILARIATLDTSVKDPTDEQLEETAEMLEMVMEVGAPQNEWEQSAVQRLHDVVVRMRESPRSSAPEKKEPEETGSARAAEGAGVTMTGAELDFLRRRYESGASMNAQQRALVEAADAQGVNRGEIKVVEFSLNPPGDAPAQPAQPVQQGPIVETTTTPVRQGPIVETTTTGGETVDWNGKPTSGAGMYVPNKDELAFLRRRRDSGASLSPQQRRILELTDGNYST